MNITKFLTNYAKRKEKVKYIDVYMLSLVVFLGYNQTGLCLISTVNNRSFNQSIGQSIN